MIYQIGHNCHIEEIMEFRHTFASFTSPFSKENVSHQNALRLTITETNMTYNFANCERWSSEPYVLGIRIRLSGNHPEEDICDELEGDCPKDFMWRGWHPRCRCSISSILMDRNSEEWKHLRSLPENEYKAYNPPTQ